MLTDRPERLKKLAGSRVRSRHCANTLPDAKRLSLEEALDPLLVTRRAIE
jgi:hypothetical protein